MIVGTCCDRLTEPLAGIMALSCWLPLGKTFPAAKKTPDTVPIIQCHGDCDPLVKYNYGQLSSSLLKTFMKNTQFTTYRGMSHSSSNDEMDDLKVRCFSRFCFRVLRTTIHCQHIANITILFPIVADVHWEVHSHGSLKQLTEKSIRKCSRYINKNTDSKSHKIISQTKSMFHTLNTFTHTLSLPPC